MDRKVALQLRTLEPWAEMAGMMHRAGFRYVSIAFGDDEDNLTSDNWREYVENIGRVLKQNELKCVMTHAPYYSLLISAEQREEKMELAMLRAVEATKILGADKIRFGAAILFIQCGKHIQLEFIGSLFVVVRFTSG